MRIGLAVTKNISLKLCYLNYLHMNVLKPEFEQMWSKLGRTDSKACQSLLSHSAAPCFKALYSLTALHEGVAFYYHLLGDWHKTIITLLQKLLFKDPLRICYYQVLLSTHICIS